MKSSYLSIILLIFISFNINAKEKIGSHIKLGTDLYVKINSEDVMSDYYTLGGKLKFYYNPIAPLTFKIEIEADTKGVELEELTLGYSFNTSRLKFGMYENDIFYDDSQNSTDQPFAMDSLTKQRIKEMGWYSDKGIGLTYTSYTGEKKRLGGSVSGSFSTAMNSPLAIGNVNYRIGSHETHIGLTGSYLRIYYVQSSEEQYYLFNAYIGNIDEDSSWNYKIDSTFGNNIGDPGGYTHYPQAAQNNSFYYSAESYLSYNKPFTKVEDQYRDMWTPSIGASYMIYDLEIPDSSSIDIKLGNKIVWNGMFYLQTDLGLRTNIYYDPELTTGLELLWALSSHFRY